MRFIRLRRRREAKACIGNMTESIFRYVRIVVVVVVVHHINSIVVPIIGK